MVEYVSVVRVVVDHVYLTPVALVGRADVVEHAPEHGLEEGIVKKQDAVRVRNLELRRVHRQGSNLVALRQPAIEQRLNILDSRIMQRLGKLDADHLAKRKQGGQTKHPPLAGAEIDEGKLGEVRRQLTDDQAEQQSGRGGVLQAMLGVRTMNREFGWRDLLARIGAE